MSEYLDEEEQLARIKGWWDQNGNGIIGAVVLGLLGIVGINWYGGHTEEQAEQATALLGEYVAAGNDTRDAVLDSLASEYDGSAQHGFALMRQAATAVEEGDYTLAQTHLQTAVDSADDSLVVDLARVRLARVQRELGLVDEALASLSAVRNSGYKPLVLELQGDIQASQGNLQAAHEAYQSAKDSLPAGVQRPLLDMKLSNVQPFNDTYVELTDALSEAMDEATRTLENASAEAEDDAVSDPSEEAATVLDEAVEVLETSDPE